MSARDRRAAGPRTVETQVPTPMTATSSSPAAAPRVDHGGFRRTVRWGRASLLLNTRAGLVGGLALLACVLVFVAALALGDYPIPVDTLGAVILGRETGFPATVVLEWRLPRAVAALIFGAALGVSGGILQSLTRNPLGSPDVIGLNAGAFTGALLAIGAGADLVVTTLAALFGGIGTAFLVYLLSYRRGVSGFRFIVVGIAVSSALIALNTLLLMRLSTVIATVAGIWGQGTLENVRWEQVVPLGVALLVLMGLALGAARTLRQLELGDDLARAAGVRIEPVRLGLIALSVGLTAVVTSLCGPIAFVALAAPHLARRLAGSAGTSLPASAAVGALLLSFSDLVASQLLPISVPVGVVTVVIGGAYLLLLVLPKVRR